MHQPRHSHPHHDHFHKRLRSITVRTRPVSTLPVRCSGCFSIQWFILLMLWPIILAHAALRIPPTGSPSTYMYCKKPIWSLYYHIHGHKVPPTLEFDSLNRSLAYITISHLTRTTQTVDSTRLGSIWLISMTIFVEVRWFTMWQSIVQSVVIEVMHRMNNQYFTCDDCTTCQFVDHIWKNSRTSKTSSQTYE